MMSFSQHIIDAIRPLPFRGKVRFSSGITPREGLVSANVFGHELELDLSNFVDRMIYMGCYEPLNTYRFKRILKPGMIVVDAGANIGYFSLLAASRVGRSGQVFAIEPWPNNLAILQRAITRNRLGQVRAFSFGLGAAAGTGRVSQADQRVYNNRTASMASLDEAGVQVSVRSLDECVADWGLARIDLLKIDVDGYETQILEGAKGAIRRGLVQNIIIELNEFWLERAHSSAATVCENLLAAGFRDLTRQQRLAAFALGPVADRHFSLNPTRGVGMARSVVPWL